MPLSICADVSANWPEKALITPILMVSWALTPAGNITAATMAAPANSERFILWSSPENSLLGVIDARMPEDPAKEKRRGHWVAAQVVGSLTISVQLVGSGHIRLSLPVGERVGVGSRTLNRPSPLTRLVSLADLSLWGR